MSSLFVGFNNISDLQTNIMLFVGSWIRVEKVPIPQKSIIEKMQQEGINNSTVLNALNGLLKKGYLRRSFSCGDNGKSRTIYVQLKSISDPAMYNRY